LRFRFNLLAINNFGVIVNYNTSSPSLAAGSMQREKAMTIPSLQTLHGVARVSVLVLFVIAMFTAQASSSLPEQAANCAVLSSAQTDPSTAPMQYENSGTTLVTASVRLVIFGVETFLKLHGQDVVDDRKTQAPD
jgi:hypothetical protein